MISNVTSCAYLFPGQGSQFLGMGNHLAIKYHTARETYLEADETLGFSISQLSWQGPETDLNDTINTQPALLVHSIASLRVLQEILPNFQPVVVAGHSMGQISALVAAGCLTFADALQLVRKRGEVMKAAGERQSGGMVAILGLDIDTIERICRDVSKENGVVQIANDNCPGQVVISGSKLALDRCIGLASSAGAKRIINLAVSIAAHSQLMESAQKEFNLAIDNTPMEEPLFPIISNVSASPIETTEKVKSELKSQLTTRVRWSESANCMLSMGIKTYFEIGSGSVLLGLLKRIDKQIMGVSLGNPEDFEIFLATN
jgi:[acyl-carrier-protein] S-malonyltransferase